MATLIKRGEYFSRMLGLEVKGALAAHNCTYQELADALNSHTSTISNYVNGKRAIPPALLVKIAEHIGVNPRDLVDRAYVRVIDDLGPVAQIGATNTRTE